MTMSLVLRVVCWDRFPSTSAFDRMVVVGISVASKKIQSMYILELVRFHGKQNVTRVCFGKVFFQIYYVRHPSGEEEFVALGVIGFEDGS